MSAAHPVASTEGRFTCVVDDHPRFHLDALRWYASLTEVAGVAATDLVVHTVGDHSSDILDFLKRAGVCVRTVDRFDPRSPHCNKISGALRLAEDKVHGLVVLCDSDIAVMEDPRRIDLTPDAVGGKVVDAPVPPLDVLLTVFTASGIPAPPTVPLPWGPGERTFSGNSNGGLYLVPGALLRPVAHAWAHWAGWLLDRLELLERWSVYVDQVAMAMALAAQDVKTRPLEVQWNTPTHDPTRIPADPPEPSVVHYHQEVDRRGLIKATGHASIDRRLGLVNDAIGVVWAQAKPHETYEKWLAGTPRADEIGRAVATVADALGPKTILDVGGDSGIEWGDRAEAVTTIDWGGDIVRALDEPGVTADLVLCLEELCHSTDAERSRDLVQRLWQSTVRALVVRGPGVPRSPDHRGPDGHAPLAALLAEGAPGAELYPVGVDGPFATYVALKPQAVKHPATSGPPLWRRWWRATPSRSHWWCCACMLSTPPGSTPTMPLVSGSTQSWPG